MDKKALLAQDGWDPSIEQQTFGDQHPYASATPPGPGPNFGPTYPAPYVPQQSFPYIPEDAPPMYSAKNPAKNASAPPSRNPQEHTSSPSRNPQEYIPPPSSPREQEDTYYPQGYQPVPQQETTPSAPPSQHHYNTHQSTPPANYGATISGPHSAPVAPRRRRLKKPKKSSCCYRCCCALLLIIIVTSWYLKDFAYLIDESCNLSDNAESDTSYMFFPVDKTLDLHYAIRDGIVGNIVVRESTDWDDYPQQVVVYRTWRASSPQLSDAMRDFVSLDEVNFKVIAGMHLVFDSTEEKKKALKNNCVRVDVEIVYPIGLPGTGRLNVETTNGDIHVKFDKILKDQPPTFDTLILAATFGEIQLENVLVISNTTLTSANGHIHGSLRTAGAVEARMLNGPIDLAIHTNIIPGQKEWNPRKLDVKLDTLNGPVTLEVPPSFQGHFKIEAVVGRASITAPVSIQYKKNTSNQVSGWVSSDGKEPPSILPRMLLSSVNGNVKAKIGTSSRN
ncbi:hypothetical protein BG006_000923 [Podila minutissima]|uniref:Adhesin domain-containing protein n=1 Tax=Podila minutissima TaxID=64525 RepID=A0A9P5SAQ6_9FUNG|nr:hypothetical protein BG006_000923 [Podila minutissima]